MDKNPREEVERIAFELYQNRLLLGKPGDERQDWTDAEQIARSPIRKILFASRCQGIKLEKRLWEPLLAWANAQAILSLLGLLSNLGLIVAVVTYIGAEKQRRDAEVLNAWQTITSAYGQSGSGGRIQALEFLNASPGANWRRKFPWFCAPLPLCTWDAEQLNGINLGAVPLDNPPPRDQTDKNQVSVYLQDIQLPKARLRNANLEGANLEDANLESANLMEANLVDTDLIGSNLAGALLAKANLVDADLIGSNLAGADLSSANLAGADLMFASLVGADLGHVNLEGANLGYVNLEGANLAGANLKNATNLWDTNLEGVDLSNANLEGVVLAGVYSLEGANLAGTNLKGTLISKEQLSKASLCDTRLPDDIDLDPNRDCKELGMDLDADLNQNQTFSYPD